MPVSEVEQPEKEKRRRVEEKADEEADQYANAQQKAELQPAEVNQTIDPKVERVAVEQLQLTLEEAFFLAWALGVLSITFDTVPLSLSLSLSPCVCM